MTEHQKHMWQAISINTLLLIAAGLVILVWRSGRLPESRPVTVQQQQAQIALDYIETLAAYQEFGTPAAVLDKVEIADKGIWVAQFDTDVKDGLRHHYYVEIQDGHVIHHQITVMDADKQLMIYSPEPEEIIGLPTLTLKGKTTAGKQVNAAIINAVSGQTVQEQHGSADADSGEFVLTFSGLSSADIKLRVQSGEKTVTIPLIVQTSL